MRGESTRHHLRRAPVAPLSLRPDSPTADSDGESAPVSRKACEDACYEVQRVRFDPLDDLEGGLDPGYLGPDVE